LFGIVREAECTQQAETAIPLRGWESMTAFIVILPFSTEGGDNTGSKGSVTVWNAAREEKVADAL
jgi:hypothetical protein